MSTKTYNPRHVPTIVTIYRGGKDATIINPHLRFMIRHTATMRKVR